MDTTALMAPKPLAIIVEDDDVMAGSLARFFEQAGYGVHLVTNLLDGESQARAALALSAPIRVVVICLDMHLPLPLVLPDVALQEALEIDGWHIAATLDSAMEQGSIQPGYLIAISVDMSDERRHYAQACGCIAAWNKPLRSRHATMLQSFITQGPPLRRIERDHHARLIRNLAAAEFKRVQITFQGVTKKANFVQESHPWTVDDARVLIGAFTAAIRLSDPERQRAEQLITQLGGISQTNILLLKCCEWLTYHQFTTQAKCLRYMVQGAHRSQLEAIIHGGRRKVDTVLERLFVQLASFLTLNHTNG